MKKYIYSWNQGSKGAKALADALGWPRIKHEGSKFRGRPDKMVVNWGSSELPDQVAKCGVVNAPGAVAIATDKLETYGSIQNKPYCPWFTTDKEQAAEWMMEEKGAAILCRKVLNGHGGQGIVIAEKPDQLVAAPLYVEYVPKKQEYRVHVLGDKVSVQQKKRRVEVADADVNWRIRNYGNGFCYARADVAPTDAIINAARDAVKLLGLHFGAVDIGWNEKYQRATLYEVNTAPGLEGTTVLEYAEYLRGL